MKAYLFIYSSAVLLAMVLTPLAIWLGWRLKLSDTPNPRKVHSGPIPRIGGAAIYVATMSLIVAVLSVPNPPYVWRNAFRTIQVQFIALLFAATAIFVVGLIDDIHHLRARTKLFGQLAAALVVCAAGIRIESVAVGEWLTINLGWFAWPLTILWIVGITNAVNLSDGLDGLAAGISAIACAVIAVFAVSSGQAIMAVLMLALLGAWTGFLCFNFNPAKVFLGDSGSMFSGFIIAASSVLCSMKSQTFVALALPALALGVPIFDTLFSMLRRFLARRSIFAPDCSHFHHRLLRLGFRQRHAVIVIYLVTLTITGLGMFMMLTEGGAATVIFGCALVLLLVLFRVVGSVRFRDTVAGLRRRLRLSRQTHAEMRTFENLQLRFEEATRPSDWRANYWWQAVCMAAAQLDFAWLCLTVTDQDGNTHSSTWRRPDTPPNLTRAAVVKIPVPSSGANISVEFEAAVLLNGSIECATRRASLFGRLVDEYTIPAIRSIERSQTLVPSTIESLPLGI